MQVIEGHACSSTPPSLLGWPLRSIEANIAARYGPPSQSSSQSHSTISERRQRQVDTMTLFQSWGDRTSLSHDCLVIDTDIIATALLPFSQSQVYLFEPTSTVTMPQVDARKIMAALFCFVFTLENNMLLLALAAYLGMVSIGPYPWNLIVMTGPTAFISGRVYLALTNEPTYDFISTWFVSGLGTILAIWIQNTGYLSLTIQGQIQNPHCTCY